MPYYPMSLQLLDSPSLFYSVIGSPIVILLSHWIAHRFAHQLVCFLEDSPVLLKPIYWSKSDEYTLTPHLKLVPDLVKVRVPDITVHDLIEALP
jgi:hypothetical protein